MKNIIVNITITIMVCITMLFGFGMVSNAIDDTEGDDKYNYQVVAAITTSSEDIKNIITFDISIDNELDDTNTLNTGVISVGSNIAGSTANY